MESIQKLLHDPAYTALLFCEFEKELRGFSLYVLSQKEDDVPQQNYYHDPDRRIIVIGVESLPPTLEELQLLEKIPKNLKLFSSYYSWLQPFIEERGVATFRYPTVSSLKFVDWLFDYLRDREVLWDIAQLYEQEKKRTLEMDVEDPLTDSDKSEGEEPCTLIDYTRNHIPLGWEKFFDDEALEMVEKISRKIEGVEFYPPLNLVYRIFELIPPEKIRVVILGQDPYINEGEAMGISFSVPIGKKVPPSLRNIYQEMKDDGFPPKDPQNGDLTRWCQQGVFLINTALTVKPGASGSHMDLWKEFTEKLINFLNYHCGKLVIILWGSSAQQLGRSFSDKHKKITSVHPSPLSANKGFFGSKPFSKANAYLRSFGKKEIDWS